MDDDGQSGLDSPTLQSNPGTPLPAHQVSNPGTPRSEDLICPPNAMAGTLPTSATSLISVATHLSSMAGGSNSNSNSSNNNNSGGPLLLQVATAGVGHSVGPGCVPQGSSITQSMTTCVNRQPPQSKYAQLLAVIEDLGKDIRPTYAGSKSSAERLKRGIVHARILISHLNCWTKFDTKLSADSVEWCPIPSRREILVCGTYELTKGQVEQRVGNLHLLRCVNNHNLEVIQKIDVPAVLDSKWCLHELNNQVVLGTTDAEGRLQLYGLKEEHIIDINSLTVGEGCIALSLDWSNVKYHSQQPLIAVSDSKGRLSIYHLNQQELRQIYQWTAHEHEAWVVAFDYWMPDVVYSGGDDCKLKVWDLRQSAKTPTFTSRQHLMGVTSIQSNQWNCNTIASGSYDERIYLWDIRKMYRPNSVVETGGGVWRLKWHPQTGKHLLAACMDAGAVIVDCHSFQTSKLWTTYREHESMVYGVDWQIPSSSLSDQETVASCSFYDHSLHLWTCSLKNRTIQRIDTRT